jgi:hypothetical protein
MVDACPGRVRRFFLLASLTLLGALASCSVYPDEIPTDAGAKGGSGGSAATGGNGGGGLGGGDASAGAGNGGSGGGTGGSTGGRDGAGGSAGSLDGSAGGGGAGRSGGAGTGGTGGGGAAGSSGSGGAAGTGGVAGAAGTGGIAGAAGTGGVAGAAGTGGIAGSSGNGGATGTGGAGTAGSSGATGTGGIAGTAGTGGGAGTGGTGVPDAAPDLPPPPGAVFAVGSFNKIGTATIQNVAHTLGQVPKALILWTVGKTSETASAGFVFGLGVSDGATSMSTSMNVRDGVAASQSARRMAFRAITLVQYDTTTTLAEADLGTMSATNFPLNWISNDGSTYVVHYLAIGGPQVSAKVVNWQAPGAPGNKIVNTVGFMPETVLHFNAGGALVATPPTQTGNGVFGLGAMDKGGGQWTAMIGDTATANPSTASRSQKTDSMMFTTTDAPAVAVTKEATFVSMDAAGFTVNFTANSSSPNQTQVFSLALAGVKAKAGFFTKSIAAQPASQPITAPGFRPGAVFFSSYQSVAQTAAVQIASSRLGIGATDGTHEGSSSIAVNNNVSPTNADGVDKVSKVFMKMDNATMTIDAESDLTSFDATGFTLNWTKNDAVPTQICYWALGAP